MSSSSTAVVLASQGSSRTSFLSDETSRRESKGIKNAKHSDRKSRSLEPSSPKFLTCPLLQLDIFCEIIDCFKNDKKDICSLSSVNKQWCQILKGNSFRIRALWKAFYQNDFIFPHLDLAVNQDFRTACRERQIQSIVTDQEVAVDSSTIVLEARLKRTIYSDSFKKIIDLSKPQWQAFFEIFKKEFQKNEIIDQLFRTETSLYEGPTQVWAPISDEDYEKNKQIRDNFEQQFLKLINAACMLALEWNDPHYIISVFSWKDHLFPFELGVVRTLIRAYTSLCRYDKQLFYLERLKKQSRHQLTFNDLLGLARGQWRMLEFEKALQSIKRSYKALQHDSTVADKSCVKMELELLYIDVLIDKKDLAKAEDAIKLLEKKFGEEVRSSMDLNLRKGILYYFQGNKIKAVDLLEKAFSHFDYKKFESKRIRTECGLFIGRAVAVLAMAQHETGGYNKSGKSVEYAKYCLNFHWDWSLVQETLKKLDDVCPPLQV